MTNHKSNLIFFILFLILSYFVINKSAKYNWDIIPYMAIAKTFETDDIEEVSKFVYNELETKVDEKKYYDLTKGSEYRKNVFENSIILKEQLAFYKSKIVYNLLVYLSYKSGINLSSSTYRINFIFYLLIGFLLFYLISISLNNWFAVVIALLIMASEQVVKLALYSTPDALSTFIILLIFVMLYKEKKDVTIVMLIILSILIRPDNIVLGGIILAYLFYIRKSSSLIYIAFASILLFVYYANIYFTEHPGWSTLFYHAFNERVLLPLTEKPTMNYEIYISAIKELEFSLYSYILALVTTITQLFNHFISKKYQRKDSLVYFLIILIVFKTLIFPINEERFFIAIDFVLIIYLFKNLVDIYKVIVTNEK